MPQVSPLVSNSVRKLLYIRNQINIQTAYKVNNKILQTRKDDTETACIATRDLNCSDCQASTRATDASCQHRPWRHFACVLQKLWLACAYKTTKIHTYIHYTLSYIHYTLCALILTWLRHFINHLLTYLLTYLLTQPFNDQLKGLSEQLWRLLKRCYLRGGRPSWCQTNSVRVPEAKQCQ